MTFSALAIKLVLLEKEIINKERIKIHEIASYNLFKMRQFTSYPLTGARVK